MTFIDYFHWLIDTTVRISGKNWTGEGMCVWTQTPLGSNGISVGHGGCGSSQTGHLEDEAGTHL